MLFLDDFLLSDARERRLFAPCCSRARVVSHPAFGPRAPLVTDFLQLPVPSHGIVYRRWAVTYVVFVVVGPRRSVNYFN